MEDGEQDKDGLSPTEPEKLVAAVQEGEPNEEVQTAGEPEMKKEALSLQPIERDPKYIFSIKFKKKPFGIVLTSAEDGNGAYVTEVDGKLNKAVKNNKLPLNSKLLKVNDKEMEFYIFDDITASIIGCMARSDAVVITFCHPDGLNEDEFPDPSPVQILGDK